jgi:ABC-type glycerol-3-phosphate transport system permease component
MPLIDRVGRRSWKVVLGFGLTYAFLILGGASMVLPFAIMLTVSVSTTVDYNDFSVCPRYLYDAPWLYRKVVHDRYNSGYWGSIRDLRKQYHRDLFEIVELGRPEAGDAQATLRDWDAFRPRIPAGHWAPGHMKDGYEDGRVQRLYREWLAARYTGDIGRYNQAHHTVHETFSRISAPQERPVVRDWVPPDTESYREWRDFRATIPPAWFFAPSLEGVWQQFILGRYQKSITSLNKVWGSAHRDFWRIPLPERRPVQDAQAQDWDAFIRQLVPPRYIELSPSLLQSYRDVVARKHETIDRLNQVYGTAYTAFVDVPLPPDLASEERLAVIQDILSLLERPGVCANIHLVDPDNRWRAFLRETYGGIDRLNVAHGTRHEAFESAAIPNALIDWHAIQAESSDWRRYFLLGNYSQVFTFLLKHGGALINTLIYCAAMLCVTLLVNPLCAYALSRFSLRYTNKILIFLLATMAFPAEVAMIPNFLLLRDLGLLNTYWALILPGLASGYSIFLLKGFFDSLPAELYEAAVIDGAGEMTIFRRITLPLAKPVLAYLGLGAFAAAYQAFLFAMITCPDPKRWTIMVFLYDMRTWATPSVTMAALVVASIPTLLIFIFAQKIIMRGIVIPIDK